MRLVLQGKHQVASAVDIPYAEGIGVNLTLKYAISICSFACLATWCFTCCNTHAHGDLHERIVAIDLQIATHTQNPHGYIQRAQLYFEHGEWSLALADYDMADKLDPKLETRLLRARVLLASGHPVDSLILLNNFLERHPGNPQAFACRARVLKKLNRHADSIRDYREALKHTETPEPDLVLEAANAITSIGSVREAVRVLDEGIGKLGHLPPFVLRAIDLEVMAKNYDSALARVGVMRQGAPRPEPWMARRASVLAQAGRIEESIAAWKALSLHLAALPSAERSSHAMSILKKETQQALASLDNRSEAGPSPSNQ